MEHRQEGSWQSLEEELTQQTYTGILTYRVSFGEGGGAGGEHSTPPPVGAGGPLERPTIHILNYS